MRSAEGAPQAGPFSAAELSLALEQGTLAWGTDVWREGLSSWRPARRDELLVLAVAGVRGLDGATHRLDAVQNLLVSQDTPRPTLRLVSSQREPATGRPARNSLAMSVRRPGRRSYTGWVALAAFLAGAYIAWKPGSRIEPEARLLSAELSSLEPGASARVAHHVGPAQAEGPRAAVGPSSPQLAADPAQQRVAALAQPDVGAEVRAALASRANRVHGCLLHPRRGLALTLHIAGTSGQVAQLELHTPRLTGGARECIRDALSDLQVLPFAEPRYVTRHAYRW